MNTRRIILSPQDRGGIGKSFVATLLYDYLVEAKVKLKTFDLDHANSTFKRLVPEAEFIHTDVDTDKLAVLDRLVGALETADTVLVDNRATGGSKILEYIEESRLTELQKELRFDLVFVLIAIEDRDALSQMAEIVDRYAGRVQWLIAKNYRDSAELTMFDSSKSRKKLSELGAIEVDVPCLAEITKNRLQMANLTVGNGRTSEKLHLLDQSRCVRFHAYMENQFDKVRTLLVP
jgi:hypothetical protein